MIRYIGRCFRLVIDGLMQKNRKIRNLNKNICKARQLVWCV
jgi:hypothetical protein